MYDITFRKIKALVTGRNKFRPRLVSKYLAERHRGFKIVYRFKAKEPKYRYTILTRFKLNHLESLTTQYYKRRLTILFGEENIQPKVQIPFIINYRNAKYESGYYKEDFNTSTQASGVFLRWTLAKYLKPWFRWYKCVSQRVYKSMYRKDRLGCYKGADKKPILYLVKHYYLIKKAKQAADVKKYEGAFLKYEQKQLSKVKKKVRFNAKQSVKNKVNDKIGNSTKSEIKTHVNKNGIGAIKSVDKNKVVVKLKRRRKGKKKFSLKRLIKKISSNRWRLFATYRRLPPAFIVMKTNTYSYIGTKPYFPWMQRFSRRLGRFYPHLTRFPVRQYKYKNWLRYMSLTSQELHDRFFLGRHLKKLLYKYRRKCWYKVTIKFRAIEKARRRAKKKRLHYKLVKAWKAKIFKRLTARFLRKVKRRVRRLKNLQEKIRNRLRVSSGIRIKYYGRRLVAFQDFIYKAKRGRYSRYGQKINHEKRRQRALYFTRRYGEKKTFKQIRRFRNQLMRWTVVIRRQVVQHFISRDRQTRVFKSKNQVYVREGFYKRLFFQYYIAMLRPQKWWSQRKHLRGSDFSSLFLPKQFSGLGKALFRHRVQNKKVWRYKDFFLNKVRYLKKTGIYKKSFLIFLTKYRWKLWGRIKRKNFRALLRKKLKYGITVQTTNNNIFFSFYRIVRKERKFLFNITAGKAGIEGKPRRAINGAVAIVKFFCRKVRLYVLAKKIRFRYTCRLVLKTQYNTRARVVLKQIIRSGIVLNSISFRQNIAHNGCRKSKKRRK